ncbi:UDP-glucose 4-epimerase GalE [Streptomyces sp. NPDC058646]|uniref:UDP-glucose 4-epimerase GalE n=1 Tax=Streptomyces sp. NPDC058646 TaxID=3346574 RepID=UPI00365ADD9E
MKVLITGGAGYIGSTIASACLDHGITPVVLDNLATGRREYLTGRHAYQGDIADGALIDRIFADQPDLQAVVHYAALSTVPQSLADPLSYYRENLSATVALTGHLIRNRCRRMLFASSVSVYGGDATTVSEADPLEPASPYARTKAAGEAFLRDAAAATDLAVIALRYANPIGTDPALRTGLQVDRPTHLLGRLISAAEDGQPFTLMGTVWPTRDGSALRDFLHVWDLAQAHVAALHRFDTITANAPFQALNLSSGTGTTVRELARAFQDVTGHTVQLREAPARPGDVAGFRVDNARATALLGWTPQLSLTDGIRHAMQWRPVRNRMLDQAVMESDAPAAAV